MALGLGTLLLGSLMAAAVAQADVPERQAIPRAAPRGNLAWHQIRNSDATIGIGFGEAIRSERPVELLIAGTDSAARYRTVSTGYQSVVAQGHGFVGVALLRPDAHAAAVARVTDRWSVDGDVVRLDRKVKVLVDRAGGFATAAQLGWTARGSLPTESGASSSYRQFIPGTMYGTGAGLSVKAIGAMGPDDRGGKSLSIREDRLPIPMTAIQAADGRTLAVLDPGPDGATTVADSTDFIKGGSEGSEAPVTLIDARIKLGAISAQVENVGPVTGQSPQTRVSVGFIYPAIERPMTYLGNIFPDAGVAVPRLVFHPWKTGFTQRYAVMWRADRSAGVPQLVRDNWRWAWNVLAPVVNRTDIGVARHSLIEQLSSQVEIKEGYAGIPNSKPAPLNDNGPSDRKTIMGFTGKALETAEYLLWAADAYRGDPAAATYRRQGEAIIDAFVHKLRLDPPSAEGFKLDTGEPAFALPLEHQVYLRSFTDDVKATLLACRREQRGGRPHPAWLAWARSFGDWLITQQEADGGVPRTWRPGSGAIADPSATSSYNAIPMWILLSELTGDAKYKDAAIRAGDYSWAHSGQRFGRFTGGTIDNPDVIDKEAGTLSLEAYLALYEQTHDRIWLDRAKAAADFAETWIYAWNVPMPLDDRDPDIHWKPGVPTVGLQLIATGHSLVDEYMAFDVDEYAKLYKYTGDRHYFDVARLLLHNTLAMTALPGRTYDLRGPGWQQEHWSLAPWRGRGFHRGWLPWVSTSHLNGMVEAEEFDKDLYERLVK